MWEGNMSKIIPEFLKAGDEVRIVAPSRGIKIIGADSRKLAAERFAEMGLKVTFGRNATDENWDMMGTSPVKDRVEDIMEAFADKNVKAIFTMIGGFNSNQLLPFLDYEVIRSNPKIFCGFSDITALLNGIYARTGLVTFSGPHFSSFGMLKGFEYTWDYMKKMLTGSGKIELEASESWSDDPWFIDQNKREFIKNDGWQVIHEGQASGTLVGGNLGTLVLLNGTEFRPRFERDTVLMVENCFDSAGDDATFMRELQAMACQPDFKNVRALLIGRFQKASEISREKLAYIVNSIPQLQKIPVVANLDFGHTTPLLTLPIGGHCEITQGRIFVEA